MSKYHIHWASNQKMSTDPKQRSKSFKSLLQEYAKSRKNKSRPDCVILLNTNIFN